MRKAFRQTPTASPITVGQFAGNSEDGWSLFQQGAYYQKPNSAIPPSTGASVLSLDFGFGQGQVSLDFGGFHSLGPPADP